MVDEVDSFNILHRIEFELDLNHEDLLQASEARLNGLIDQWFRQRSNVTGVPRKPSDSLKSQVFDWKEEERELEEF